jgi:tyrosine-protein phosphatase YwqE
MQVDATTLTRPTTRGHRARQLISSGLADVIAADNHGDARSIVTGAEYLRRRDGVVHAQQLTLYNPNAVIDDVAMQLVPPLPLKERWRDRFRRFAQGS